MSEEYWPLAGIRVVDFTWAWAGPHMSRLLADLGAEVIKVESSMRRDTIRGFDEKTINQSGNFNQLNRNKLSCLLNLRHPEGIEYAKKLVAQSDVVTSNFSPGVMERLGLGFEDLKKVKPDIVWAALSGYGQTGPESRYVTYGPPMSYLSGLAAVTGYEDDRVPRMLGSTYCDAVAGGHGAFAILAALHHRDLTGEGQAIDISMWEAMINMLPEAVMEYSLTGRVPTMKGNRDEVMAPHGCYRCAGEDQWVAIAVRDDRDWEGLCLATGHPEWLSRPEFADQFLRWQNQEAIEELLEEWTQQRTPREVTDILQSRGVPSGPSYSVPQMLEDENLVQRGFFVVDDHPEMPGRKLNGLAWKISDMPRVFRRPAPRFGEHTQQVFSAVLGVSAEEYERLCADGVIR